MLVIFLSVCILIQGRSPDLFILYILFTRCARALSQGQSDADRHVLKWANLLDIFSGLSPDRIQEFLDLPAVNFIESRMCALVNLYACPDLSRGIASPAGEFKTDGRDKIVTFDLAGLENLAFPALCGASGKSLWTPTCGIDLLHYSYARLYSALPLWRQQPDYVAFSLHRLAAYNAGGDSVQAAVQALPKPMPMAAATTWRLHDFEQVRLDM